MNITVEQMARKQCEELYDLNHVKVKIRTSWHLGFCMPDEQGDREETALFNTLTYGDYHILEKATSYEVEVGEKFGGEKVTTQVMEINEYKRLLIKRCLVDWSLDIPIVRDQYGWMTAECYNRVSCIAAPLLEVIVRKFEESIEITEAEEEKITRQAVALFSKTGHGVNDACEAVSLFCTLGNFSEKFGINRDDLPRMPYKDYLLLKIMMAKEGDSLRSQQTKSGSGKSSGNARSNRGMRIPLPGSGG